MVNSRRRIRSRVSPSGKRRELDLTVYICHVAATQYLESTKESRTVTGDDIGVNGEEFDKHCGVGMYIHFSVKTQC